MCCALNTPETRVPIKCLNKKKKPTPFIEFYTYIYAIWNSTLPPTARFKPPTHPFL